jgi:hypothetical protein
MDFFLLLLVFGLFYLFIYSISFNVIQPMWLCGQIEKHNITDMSKHRNQTNKQTQKENTR